MTEDSHIQSTEERAGSRLRQISFIFFSFFHFSSFVYGLFPYLFVSISVYHFSLRHVHRSQKTRAPSVLKELSLNSSCLFYSQPVVFFISIPNL